MARYNHSYIICGKYLKDVEKFLEKNYLKRIKTQYTFYNWITFKVPKSDYKIALTSLKGRKLTQNMTFEISCKTKTEFDKFIKKTRKKPKNFIAEETGKPYRYNYLTIKGPAGICDIEINYIEHL